MSSRHAPPTLATAIWCLAGVATAGSLFACNSPSLASVRSTAAPSAPTKTATRPAQSTCQHQLQTTLSDSGAVSVAKAVGGSVASVRYWLRNRPGSGTTVLSGFPGTAHATVCVYRGWFPVPVPPGVPTPTGARYIVNPAGIAAMDVAGPFGEVLSSTPAHFPAGPSPHSS